MGSRESRNHADDGVSLPADIIFDVLVRLPANALRRFRCVSKAWRALISDPAFAAAQRSHAGRLIVGVFGSRPSHPELRVLDMRGNVLRVFKPMDGCALLLAPTQVGRLFCVDRMRGGAMIVDPAAGRAFTVGRNDALPWSRWSHSSFGRAVPSGAFKVLRLHQPITWGCDVATITDGGAAEPTWRQRVVSPPFSMSVSPQHKATINGVLYFVPSDDSCHRNRIAAFDLESEAWMETINGPPQGFEIEQDGRCVTLTELMGSLCLAHSRNGPNYVSPYVNIWRLIDHNRSVWVKAYRIWFPDEECLYLKPLDVLEDGRILLLNTSHSRYIIQYFNPSTEAFTDIMEMAEGFTGTMNFYTGSMLSS